MEINQQATPTHSDSYHSKMEQQPPSNAVSPSLSEHERYIDECYRVLQSNSSVEDIVVINKFGNPVKSTMDAETSLTYGGAIDLLVAKSLAAVKAIDGTELEQVRIRTKKNEVYILPDKYELTFIVHQAKLEEEHPEASVI